jgi:hypothetical protein
VFRFRLAGTGILGLYDLEMTSRRMQEAFGEQAAERNADFT